jgi:hypothetical protein
MASDSTIWYGLWREYLLEHWTLAGKHLESVERAVDWFPAAGEAMRSRMDATLQWLHCDSQDRLWVGLTAPRRSEGTQRVVEVIDAHSGTLLARADGVHRPIDGWIDEDLAWKIHEMETGNLQALILRPRLIPR